VMTGPSQAGSGSRTAYVLPAQGFSSASDPDLESPAMFLQGSSDAQVTRHTRARWTWSKRPQTE
jgi:surfactin synthase thioesterase subunit